MATFACFTTSTNLLRIRSFNWSTTSAARPGSWPPHPSGTRARRSTASARRLGWTRFTSSIQRDRAVGWKFAASETPEPQTALDDQAEEEEQNAGVLRAVLEGEDVLGEILTP